MDQISDDMPASGFAFDSESETSNFEETPTPLKDTPPMQKNALKTDYLGNAVQDLIVEPETPQTFFQEEDEKLTLKEYFQEKMKSVDPK